MQVDPKGLWGEEGSSALPCDAAGELSGSEAGKQRNGDGGGDHAEQACSDASVGTKAKGEMGSAAAGEVDPVRMGEGFRVSVAGVQAKKDALSFANFSSVDGGINGCQPGEDAGEAGVTYQLFHRMFGQLGLQMEASPFVRVL